LDNIVTDGMRVAVEVKRRMDDAQRELERNVSAGAASSSRSSQHHQDEYDEEDQAAETMSIGGRSVREADRDLLEGADAEAVGGEEGVAGSQSTLDKGRRRGESIAEERVVEFEH